MTIANWVIIELNDNAESATYPEIRTDIIKVFGEVDFFIPKHHEELGSYTSTHTLFEGYIFVKDSSDVREKLSGMGSRYLSGPLKITGKVRTVPTSEIHKMQKTLTNSIKKSIEPGTMVKINEGIFEHLTGEVIDTEEDGKIVNVNIKCLSREILAPIPTTCLEIIKK